MSKINKIKLSGTTYDIQDLNATSVVNVTQAQYEAMVTGGTVDPTILYNITDAQAGDLSQYWTSAQTNSAITEAVSGKQDTLVSGTNIKTINNESILGSGNIDIQGGGGKAIEAGRGISVTTGETADTVSFNLPMSADTIGLAFFDSKDLGEISTGNSTNRYNIVLGGYYNKIGGNGSNRMFKGNFICGWNSKIVDEIYAFDNSAMYNIIFGTNNTLSGNGKPLYSSIIVGDDCYGQAKFQSLFGFKLQAQNISEHSIGQYNVSTSASTAWGDSGNTLFSVGNGTSNSARHNAFEIRQNGDIYCSDGTNDVKLQDTITATAANTTALGGLKLVKLTQSEYDSLATKDDNTVYFIGDSNGYTMKIGSANVN